MLRIKYVPTPRTFKDVNVAIYDYSISELPIFEGSFQDASIYLKSKGYNPLFNIENNWVKYKPPLTIPSMFHKIALLFKETFNENWIKAGQGKFKTIKIKLATFTSIRRFARRSSEAKNSST